MTKPLETRAEGSRADLSRWRVLPALGITLLGLAAGGCYHPDARLDTVSPIAGNAIAHNKAIQTIDPWPDHAFRRHQDTDGERVRKSYETYRTGGQQAQSGGGSGNGSSFEKPAGS